MRRRVILFGAVLAALFVAIAGLRAISRADPPALSIPQGALDLGEVWATKSLSLEVPVTNTASNPIKVKEIRTSCGCTRVQPTDFELQPGSSQVLSVTMNLQGYSGDQEIVKVDVGSAFDIGLMPVFAQEGKQATRVQWHITGRVHTAINVPHTLYFDRIDMDAAPASQIFSVTPLVDVERLELPSPSQSAQARVLDLASRANLRTPISIEVTLGSLQSPGWFDIPLNVVPVLPGQKRLPPQEVRLLGTAVSDIDWAPKQFIFGARVGTSGPVTGELSIWSRSGTPFDLRIDHADASDQGPNVYLREPGVKKSRFTATVRLDDLHASAPRVRMLASGGRLNQPIAIDVPVRVQAMDTVSVLQSPKAPTTVSQ